MTGPVQLPPSTYVPFIYLITDEKMGVIVFLIILAIAICFLLMTDRNGESFL